MMIRNLFFDDSSFIFLLCEYFFSLLEIIFNRIGLVRDGNEWKILRVRRRI